jgi:hypothetical protein
MHPLTKRITLLVSAFCLILGLFLLGYNLQLIPEATKQAVVDLWPLVLILAGILLLTDSLMKRRFTRSSLMQRKEFPLPMEPDSAELLCRVHFSYGTLNLCAAKGSPILTAEQIGPMGDPAIVRETRGATTILAITTSQPFFPSYFQLLNTWHLGLPRSLPARLELHLHEANLLMDLRRLSVESIDMRAGYGKQEIYIGGLQKKLTAQIYSSSADLSIVLPSRAYAQVVLLNPFCRVDYPQGDLERKEDGSFVSTGVRDSQRSVEISIDGPIRNLVLDVENAEGLAET